MLISSGNFDKSFDLKSVKMQGLSQVLIRAAGEREERGGMRHGWREDF